MAVILSCKADLKLLFAWVLPGVGIESEVEWGVEDSLSPQVTPASDPAEVSVRAS
jgi:hypothetical protein